MKGEIDMFEQLLIQSVIYAATCLVVIYPTKKQWEKDRKNNKKYLADNPIPKYEGIENYGKHSALSKIKFAKRLQDFYKVKPTKITKRDMTGKSFCLTYYPIKLRPEDPATKMVLDQMTNQPSADEDTVGQINF